MIAAVILAGTCVFLAGVAVGRATAGPKVPPPEQTPLPPDAPTARITLASGGHYLLNATQDKTLLGSQYHIEELHVIASKLGYRVVP